MRLFRAGLAAALAGLCLMAGHALPAQASPDVEFDLPDGKQVDATQMAKALLEALETAGPAERPLLLHALARVMQMHPNALIADASRGKPQPVY